MKILMILLLNISLAQAMEVWVTGTEPTAIKNLPEEIKDHDVQNLTDLMLQNPIEPSQKEKIYKTLLEAQNEELKHNYTLAIELNEKALGWLLSGATIGGYQKTVFGIFVRLAELYKEINQKEKSENFWEKSLAWDSRAELNEEMFSKNTIKKFKSLKKPSLKTLIKIKAPPTASIFVNGKMLVSRREVEVYSGRHQIAVLIPGSPWQIENLILNKASAKPYVFSFKPKSYVSGNCQKPIVSGLALPSDTRLVAYFERENCFAVLERDSWFDMKGSPLGTKKEFNSSLKSIVSTELKSENWFKKVSPWVWVGVGSIASTLLMIKVQEAGLIQPLIF